MYICRENGRHVCLVKTLNHVGQSYFSEVRSATDNCRGASVHWHTDWYSVVQGVSGISFRDTGYPRGKCHVIAQYGA